MEIRFNGQSFDPNDLNNISDLFRGKRSNSQEDDRQEQPDSGSKPGKSAKKRKPVTGKKALILSLLITLVVGLISFYISIPALNFRTTEFYTFIIWLCIVYAISYLILSGFHRENDPGEVFSGIKDKCKIPAGLAALCIVVMIIGSITGAVIFHASAYSSLLPIRSGDFAEEVTEISWDQIPMLDSFSANTLANRKLGELSDLVSQFEVDEESAQINYQDRPVRVTYLNYGDIIKWLKNRNDGIPAYFVTDMTTQAVSVVRLEEGIHYSPSEPLNRNIDRWLRFHYPTALFGDVNFEVDEDGAPYWVASVEKRTIGLFGGTDIKGAVLVNAVTGECTYYDTADIPSWVDRVYDSDLVMNQYDYYGRYHNGFWNSIFGQTGCTETTDGYNYIAMDDDVWLYTGITSLSGDQSNIGFILVNQRTKDARFYSCAGANEYSAMYSAEGAVQQYSYESTFPLLLNIEGEPSYFMALKDASQLVKMYAMVNVQEYQIVATGTSVSDTLQNYLSLLASNGIISNEEAVIDTGEAAQVTGRITEIRSAVMDGNTTYFIRLEGEDVYYTITALQAPEAVILNVGDTVTITYTPAEDTQLLTASAIE